MRTGGTTLLVAAVASCTSAPTYRAPRPISDDYLTNALRAPLAWRLSTGGGAIVAIVAPQQSAETRIAESIVRRIAPLEVSARTPDGEIMGLRHRRFAVEGVQFHPESILTAAGKALLQNFLWL